MKKIFIQSVHSTRKLGLVLIGAFALGPAQAGPISPVESLEQFEVFDDLEIDQLLVEPLVKQPVFLNFDERGRMWVVQYQQYPHPAGLKMTSRDNYWRAIYDKVPPAPPNHIRGRDKITIHEDTDGDGVLDRHKTFVEGLNIVTSLAHGRGGVWLLNPPYLLFYPDKNRDDIPDSDPVVHLAGFGLEDTHSVVNSLRWGPDGWLYAAQGSTVSAKVRRPGFDEKEILSMGQNIWRYHPGTRRYEVFAEGGGNAFGVEFDAQGRLWVADRGNHRLEIFDQEGNYLESRYQYGRISDLFITEDEMVYAIDSESNRLRHINWRNGVRIGPVDQDLLVGFIPPWESDSRPNHGVTGEGVGVDEDGNVFVAEGPASLSDAGSAFTKYVVAGM